MFTEDDFLHYFNQLQRIEIEMNKTYQYLSNEIEHPEYKNLFNRLAKEELDHLALVQSLKDLIAR
jgi:rubrerythrin